MFKHRLNIETAQWADILKLTERLLRDIDKMVDICLDDGDPKGALEWQAFETQVSAHLPMIAELARLQARKPDHDS
jgi:hypothetical protein